MWEFVEMVRKLLLSLVGVFFPEKGPVSIAVALLLSVFFWLLQENNQPFRSPTCNNLQRLCMGVLSLLYFFGLIITIDAPDAASKSRQVDSSCVVYATCFEFVIWLQGAFLIVLVVSTMVTAAALIWVLARSSRNMLQGIFHDFNIKVVGPNPGTILPSYAPI